MSVEDVRWRLCVCRMPSSKEKLVSTTVSGFGPGPEQGTLVSLSLTRKPFPLVALIGAPDTMKDEDVLRVTESQPNHLTQGREGLGRMVPHRLIFSS